MEYKCFIKTRIMKELGTKKDSSSVVYKINWKVQTNWMTYCLMRIMQAASRECQDQTEVSWHLQIYIFHLEDKDLQ